MMDLTFLSRRTHLHWMAVCYKSNCFCFVFFVCHPNGELSLADFGSPGGRVFFPPKTINDDDDDDDVPYN